MGGSQCEPTGVTPQLGVGGARYRGPSCLSITVSTSQSLHPWPAAVTIRLRLFRGSSGDLSPAWRRGGCDSGDMGSMGGGEHSQNSDLLAHWVLLQLEAWNVRSGSAFAVSLGSSEDGDD